MTATFQPSSANTQHKRPRKRPKGRTDMFKFQYDGIGYESTSKFDNETAIFFLEIGRGDWYNKVEAWHTNDERKIRLGLQNPPALRVGCPWSAQTSGGYSAEDKFINMVAEWTYDSHLIVPENITFDEAVDAWFSKCRSFEVFDVKEDLLEFISKAKVGSSSLVEMLEWEGFIKESIDDDD